MKAAIRWAPVWSAPLWNKLSAIPEDGGSASPAALGLQLQFCPVIFGLQGFLCPALCPACLPSAPHALASALPSSPDNSHPRHPGYPLPWPLPAATALARAFPAITACSPGHKVRSPENPWILSAWHVDDRRREFQPLSGLIQPLFSLLPVTGEYRPCGQGVAALCQSPPPKKTAFFSFFFFPFQEFSACLNCRCSSLYSSPPTLKFARFTLPLPLKNKMSPGPRQGLLHHFAAISGTCCHIIKLNLRDNFVFTLKSCLAAAPV